MPQYAKFLAALIGSLGATAVTHRITITGFAYSERFASDLRSAAPGKTMAMWTSVVVYPINSYHIRYNGKPHIDARDHAGDYKPPKH